VKILKYIIGVLAALYAIAQVFAVIRGTLGGAFNLQTPYGMGELGGCVGGMAVGAAIAILCFRSATKSG
jgi:hypothetical protein